MKRFDIFVAVAFFVGNVWTTQSFAASSGWINAHDLQRFHSSVLLRQKQMPTGIKCRNNNAVTGMDRRNTLVNITYRPIKKGLKWRWAWGGAVGIANAKAKKDGFKLVSSGSFRRDSGLVIRCGIWHKTQ